MEVMDHFRNYTQIPQIKELSDQVTALRGFMGEQVRRRTMFQYRVTHLLVDLGRPDFEYVVPPSCVPSHLCQFPSALAEISQAVGHSISKSTQPRSTSR